jgi:hypothetical protein
LAAAAQIEPVRTEPALLRFAPELTLLLACSQPVSDRNPRLDAILALPLNWDRVLRLADHHRLLPAVYLALRGRSDVPASIHSATRARFQRQERRTLRFTAELARILRQFDHHGIRVLAHKGAVLGQFLYGDASMRQFGDLDFLVQAADVSSARSALQQLGYAAKIQLSPRQEKAYLRSGYEHVFGLKIDHNLVEVQWQIVPRFYAIDFDMKALFSRSIECDLDGLRLRCVGGEDLMLVLCVHAAKHEWAQLGMLRDIAALARLDLDWGWIDAEARRLGIMRILAISLLLARNLLGLNPPDPQIVQCQNADALAAAVEAALLRGADPQPESAAYFHFMTRVRERWQDRTRLIWRLVTTPSVGEWHAVRLADFLFPLYRGVRALRLMRRLSPD